MKYNEGDLIRVRGKGDTIYTLEDINPDPNFDPADETWATATHDEYSSVELDGPDEVQFVMSAADAAKRTIPTPDEIAKALDILGDGWGGPLDVNESETEGGGVLRAYGRTSDGLRVSFKLTVSEVERVDW